MNDYITDEERASIGVKLFNAYVKADGKIAEISWKTEGRYGPMYAYAEGVQPYGMRPYGSPDPEGVFYLGWQTRAEARKAAKALGAKFQEW